MSPSRALVVAWVVGRRSSERSRVVVVRTASAIVASPPLSPCVNGMRASCGARVRARHFCGRKGRRAVPLGLIGVCGARAPARPDERF
ncbi:hypothetical protein WS91_06700 [Burkholderia sp. MSMB1498]|nr:hypothetical protein WS91_06700 [Burkholderia sp. MSMB1498]